DLGVGELPVGGTFAVVFSLDAVAVALGGPRCGAQRRQSAGPRNTSDQLSAVKVHACLRAGDRPERPSARISSALRVDQGVRRSPGCAAKWGKYHNPETL